MDRMALMQDIPVPLTPDEETESIKAAQANPALFERVYRLYVRQVYRYFYSRTGQTAEAEDLTSQTFLEALESLGRYRPTGPFAAWLFTIARRRAIDHLRRRKPQTSLADEQADTSAGPQEQVIDRQEADWLRDRIARLKPAEQELIRLRFAAGLGFAEIARLLGRREASVKMALYRLLDRLERDLENRHE